MAKEQIQAIIDSLNEQITVNRKSTVSLDEILDRINNNNKSNNEIEDFSDDFEVVGLDEIGDFDVVEDFKPVEETKVAEPIEEFEDFEVIEPVKVEQPIKEVKSQETIKEVKPVEPLRVRVERELHVKLSDDVTDEEILKNLKPSELKKINGFKEERKPLSAEKESLLDKFKDFKDKSPVIDLNTRIMESRKLSDKISTINTSQSLTNTNNEFKLKPENYSVALGRLRDSLERVLNKELDDEQILDIVKNLKQRIDRGQKGEINITDLLNLDIVESIAREKYSDSKSGNVVSLGYLTEYLKENRNSLESKTGTVLNAVISYNQVTSRAIGESDYLTQADRMRSLSNQLKEYLRHKPFREETKKVLDSIYLDLLPKVVSKEIGGTKEDLEKEIVKNYPSLLELQSQSVLALDILIDHLQKALIELQSSSNTGTDNKLNKLLEPFSSRGMSKLNDAIRGSNTNLLMLEGDTSIKGDFTFGIINELYPPNKEEMKEKGVFYYCKAKCPTCEEVTNLEKSPCVIYTREGRYNNGEFDDVFYPINVCEHCGTPLVLSNVNQLITESFVSKNPVKLSKDSSDPLSYDSAKVGKLFRSLSYDILRIVLGDDICKDREEEVNLISGDTKIVKNDSDWEMMKEEFYKNMKYRIVTSEALRQTIGEDSIIRLGLEKDEAELLSKITTQNSVANLTINDGGIIKEKEQKTTLKYNAKSLAKFLGESYDELKVASLTKIINNIIFDSEVYNLEVIVPTIENLLKDSERYNYEDLGLTKHYHNILINRVDKSKAIKVEEIERFKNLSLVLGMTTFELNSSEENKVYNKYSNLISTADSETKKELTDKRDKEINNLKKLNTSLLPVLQKDLGEVLDYISDLMIVYRASGKLSNLLVSKGLKSYNKESKDLGITIKCENSEVKLEKDSITPEDSIVGSRVLIDSIQLLESSFYKDMIKSISNITNYKGRVSVDYSKLNNNGLLVVNKYLNNEINRLDNITTELYKKLVDITSELTFDDNKVKPLYTLNLIEMANADITDLSNASTLENKSSKAVLPKIGESNNEYNNRINNNSIEIDDSLIDILYNKIDYIASFNILDTIKDSVVFNKIYNEQIPFFTKDTEIKSYLNNIEGKQYIILEASQAEEEHRKVYRINTSIHDNYKNIFNKILNGQANSYSQVREELSYLDFRTSSVYELMKHEADNIDDLFVEELGLSGILKLYRISEIILDEEVNWKSSLEKSSYTKFAEDLQRTCKVKGLGAFKSALENDEAIYEEQFMRVVNRDKHLFDFRNTDIYKILNKLNTNKEILSNLYIGEYTNEHEELFNLIGDMISKIANTGYLPVPKFYDSVLTYKVLLAKTNNFVVIDNIEQAGKVFAISKSDIFNSVTMSNIFTLINNTIIGGEKLDDNAIYFRDLYKNVKDFKLDNIIPSELDMYKGEVFNKFIAKYFGYLIPGYGESVESYTNRMQEFINNNKFCSYKYDWDTTIYSNNLHVNLKSPNLNIKSIKDSIKKKLNVYSQAIESLYQTIRNENLYSIETYYLVVSMSLTSKLLYTYDKVGMVVNKYDKSYLDNVINKSIVNSNESLLFVLDNIISIPTRFELHELSGDINEMLYQLNQKDITEYTDLCQPIVKDILYSELNIQEPISNNSSEDEEVELMAEESELFNKIKENSEEIRKIIMENTDKADIRKTVKSFGVLVSKTYKNLTERQFIEELNNILNNNIVEMINSL